MNLRSRPLPRTINNEDLNDTIIDSIRDIKGKSITKLDLTALDDAPADYFIICEGESNTQIRALADNVFRRVRDEQDLRPDHIEGKGAANWILVDYFTTVVHIFYPETRSFYDLEDLWSDAQITYYENL